MLYEMIKKVSKKNAMHPIKNFPISTKVTLWYTSLITLILIALIFFSMEIATAIVEDSNQLELSSAVREIAAEPDDFESYEDGIYFALLEDNEIVEGSYPHHFRGTFRKSPKKPTLVTMGKYSYLYFDAPTKYNNGKIWVRGVLSVTQSINNIKRLTLVLVWIAPFSIILMSLGGYIIIKKAFKSVERLSSTAQEIKINRDFSSRLYVSNAKDEIHSMALVLNNMLDSLEQTYNKERQFSNDVSHELRTPISVILSESEYSLKYAKNLEDATESLEVIKRQALRMSTMIKSVLELSRMENMNTIKKEHIDISKMLISLSKDYGHSCANNSIQLICNIDDNIIIDTNSVLFERLVDNLMSNAVKFTKDKIELSLLKKNDTAQLSVKDNGPGIDKSQYENIWNRFYQVDESRNKEQNTGIGLGLSFVDKIAKIHGWKLDISENTHGGCTFTVTMETCTAAN